MPRGYVDAHAHLNTLSWATLDAMSQAGVTTIVSPIMLDAAKAVSKETIVDLWDYLLEVQLPRAAEHFMTGHAMVCVNMASSPRDDAARLFALLPAYLKRPGVVAIGEVGFEPHSRTCPDLAQQEAWIRLQLEMSRDTPMPIVIHTPNPPDEKRRYTDRVLDLCRAVNIPMTQVAIDHGASANIPLALEAGAYVGISVQPFRGMTPEGASELIRTYGPERIMLNSDCSPFHSDPLAVPKTVYALRRRGVPEATIEAVSRGNAEQFYRLERCA
jgi:predicted metal-dependent TIM-barrel fold hydrolase